MYTYILNKVIKKNLEGDWRGFKDWKDWRD